MMRRTIFAITESFEKWQDKTTHVIDWRTIEWTHTCQLVLTHESQMRVYQCIHKYAPHIPAFEKRWGIGGHSSFSEIHNAILSDGYASVYRLMPPPEHPDARVFFTLWNYERLQHAWAKEQGLQTTDLDEIRLVQIKYFEPDVVYDFSSFVSPGFAARLRKQFAGKILAWNGFVKEFEPPVDTAYDGYLSLHRPFVESWKRRGYRALELQPGVDPEWAEIEPRGFRDREDDLILYGQIGSLFGKRLELVNQVAESAPSEGYGFKCYAYAPKRYYRPGASLARMGIHVPFLVKWPGKRLRKVLNKPVYGTELVAAIRDAKLVLNSFGDLNVSFQSNMRIFEAIGNGTPLLSPRGVYPEGLTEGLDFFPYSSVDDIAQTSKYLLSEPDAALEFAIQAKDRIFVNFSKARQYSRFANFVAHL